MNVVSLLNVSEKLKASFYMRFIFSKTVSSPHKIFLLPRFILNISSPILAPGVRSRPTKARAVLNGRGGGDLSDGSGDPSVDLQLAAGSGPCRAIVLRHELSRCGYFIAIYRPLALGLRRGTDSRLPRAVFFLLFFWHRIEKSKKNLLLGYLYTFLNEPLLLLQEGATDSIEGKHAHARLRPWWHPADCQISRGQFAFVGTL